MKEETNHTDPIKQRKIFLAEDDIDDQEFLSEALLLADPQISMHCFSSGIKFMNHILLTPDEQLPHLIVLDYNIPEMNGADILKQLGGERFAGIPKIIWSTSDSELYRKNCLSLGASAYLVKPSNIAGINDVAKEMLGYC